jgi:histidyl-tRNA synthetase
MRAAARRCGFVELETPSVESLELYQTKSGEEISEQLWAFTDKGGRQVALAAETTPSLARVLAERAKSEPMPVKWFTVSRLWRYEEPQAGRTREFTQFNLDILGVEGPEAEVEVLAAAALALDDAGASGLYAFRINDRYLAEGLGRRFGTTDPAAFFRALDRLRKVPPEVTAAALEAAGVPAASQGELLELLASSGEGVRPAEAPAFLDRLAALNLPAPGPAGLERLRTIMELVGPAGLGDRVRLDLGVVRGLAYYTGAVFEAFDLAGAHRSLFGGGRYDRLIELFGGPPTPACGLAIGDQTLEILLKEHGRWPSGEPGLDTFFVAVSPEDRPFALEWVQRLRRAGRSADLDLLGRSMSRQLREAARRGARRAVLVGPRERSRGVVVERDLATGAQREIPPEELLAGG